MLILYFSMTCIIKGKKLEYLKTNFLSYNKILINIFKSIRIDFIGITVFSMQMYLYHQNSFRITELGVFKSRGQWLRIYCWFPVVLFNIIFFLNTSSPTNSSSAFYLFKQSLDVLFWDTLHHELFKYNVYNQLRYNYGYSYRRNKVQYTLCVQILYICRMY